MLVVRFTHCPQQRHTEPCNYVNLLVARTMPPIANRHPGTTMRAIERPEPVLRVGFPVVPRRLRPPILRQRFPLYCSFFGTSEASEGGGGPKTAQLLQASSRAHRSALFSSRFSRDCKPYEIGRLRNNVRIMEQPSHAPEGDAVPSGSVRNGWIALGPYNWLTPALTLSLTSGLLVGLVVNIAFQILNALLDTSSSGLGVGFEILAFVVAVMFAFAVVALIQHLRYPQPFADFESARLQVGRRVVPFSDIDWARFEVVTIRGRRARLTLMFGALGGPRVIFNVSSEGRWAMTPATRELVARVIRQSRIEMPTSSYDPSGHFARYNFPSNLDKQMALTAVMDPESIIEDLPIA